MCCAKMPKIRGVEVDDLIGWERGEMTQEQEIELFQTLVDNGQAWTLQGMYGRRAKQLIDSGDVCPMHVTEGRDRGEDD